jgi:serine/threonine-protein kinase
MDALEGTPFRPVRLLGESLMSLVFLAEPRDGKGPLVVVKVLRPELADYEELPDRLWQEAMVLSAIRSRHVVRVIAFQRLPDGRPYMVQEHLQGHVLETYLDARGAMPVAEALRVVLGVLAGLDAAHEHDVIHRDVKASNVFLEKRGNAAFDSVLLDFGIAKVLGSRIKTRSGQIIGTPKYLSPEQIRRAPLGPESDIYQVGLLLYRMLVGQGPFDGRAEPRSVMEAHLYVKPPAPSARAVHPVPPVLDRIVLKALEKKPELRFRSAREMEQAVGLLFDEGWRVVAGSLTFFIESEVASARQRASSRHDGGYAPRRPGPNQEGPEAGRRPAVLRSTG